jgi:hypothetical protein
MFVFLGIPIASFVLIRRFFTTGERGWAAYSLLTGVGMLGAFVAASMGFLQNPSLVSIAGVFQRLSIIIGMAWITLLAIHLLRTPATDSPMEREKLLRSRSAVASR